MEMFRRPAQYFLLFHSCAELHNTWLLPPFPLIVHLHYLLSCALTRAMLLNGSFPVYTQACVVVFISLSFPAEPILFEDSGVLCYRTCFLMLCSNYDFYARFQPHASTSSKSIGTSWTLSSIRLVCWLDFHPDRKTTRASLQKNEKDVEGTKNRA